MKNLKRDILILNRLLSSVYPDQDLSNIVELYLKHLSKLRKSVSLRYCIKYMKTVRLHITRYNCGQPLFVNSAGVSVNKQGWPTRFEYMLPLTHTQTGLRVLNTILSYTRSISPTSDEMKKIKPDYSSITDKSKATKFYTIPPKFILQFIKKNNLKCWKEKMGKRHHYISMKMSPNGPATTGSLWSGSTLPENIKNYIKTFCGDYWNSYEKFLTKEFSSNGEFNPKIKDEWKTTFGKLAIRNDPELKLRVIAMLDYHSQFCLRPIHTEHLLLLKEMPCDRTFNQDPFHRWESNNESFHSLDLSSATDRFPIHLQQKFISYQYRDKEFGEAWKGILTDRDYSSEIGPIRYEVGQPMGAYSSWSTFALTHHLVIAWCAHLVGIDDFDQYIVLGDDVVIKNDKVANKYRTIMRRLGVDISEAKTHVSKHTYEFAKRWITIDGEISGIPLKGILGQWDNIMVVYNTIREYYTRLPNLSTPLLPLMAKLYDRIAFKQGKKTLQLKYKDLLRYLYDFDIAMRFNFGSLDNCTLRNYLCRKTKDSEFPIPQDHLILQFMKRVLSEGLNKEFSTAYKEIKKQMRSYNTNFGRVSQSNSWVVHSPLINGYVNHLQNVSDLLVEASYDDKSIIDVAQALRFERVESVAQLKRNPALMLNTLCRLWKRAIKFIDPPNVSFYENWNLHSALRYIDPHLGKKDMWNSSMRADLTEVKNEFSEIISEFNTV